MCPAKEKHHDESKVSVKWREPVYFFIHDNKVYRSTGGGKLVFECHLDSHPTVGSPQKPPYNARSPF